MIGENFDEHDHRPSGSLEGGSDGIGLSELVNGVSVSVRENL
jgi:hypothetical protein